jgi:LmbE family N-acetylglucosaminyl deacetylase
MIGRRSFVRSLVAVPLVGCAGAVRAPGNAGAAAAPKPAGSRLKVVCVGAHPDDPESGCGGTLARYAEAGHAVTILYLTAGEKGIPGVPEDETAKRRRAEAKDACAILGATAVFAGQVNGKVVVTPETTDAFRKVYDAESPDVVFAPWPLDVDWEHQAASLLTLRAYLAAPAAASGARAPLYYYEVQTGAQTLGFAPSVYVDISKTRGKKTDALHAHKSQSFERMYEQHHEKIEAFRGRELGVFAAEAFSPLGPDAKTGALPGL